MKLYQGLQTLIAMVFFATCTAYDRESNLEIQQECTDQDDQEDDEDGGEVGEWVGSAPKRCFFSNRDFIYPIPTKPEQISRQTDAWPGKREDSFFEALTR